MSRAFGRVSGKTEGGVEDGTTLTRGARYAHVAESRQPFCDPVHAYTRVRVK